MVKRTPEEIQAQREAFLEKRIARASKSENLTSTISLTKSQPSPARPAQAVSAERSNPRAASSPPSRGKDISRREFLNYAWLASIALFAVETVGVGLWFAYPVFKAGQFGGQFNMGAAADTLPPLNGDPIPYTDGKFWLVNLDTTGPEGELRKGVLALYNVCTHLGCLYSWVPMTNRFECPCHGSKFALTGDYLAGPAPRGLDRFVIQAVSPDGVVKQTDEEGNPLRITGDEILIVDTGKRILGKPRS